MLATSVRNATRVSGQYRPAKAAASHVRVSVCRASPSAAAPRKVPTASAQVTSSSRRLTTTCKASLQPSHSSATMRKLRVPVSTRKSYMSASSTVRRAPARGALRVEANIFARITRLIKSTVDNFVGNFEEPEKLLDRVVNEMQDDSIRMRQAAAQVMASQRQMETKQKYLQQQADGWLRRAELAVNAGQEDLAREALKRRKTIEADAERMAAQVKAQLQASEQLQANVRMLENKIGEAKNKKETLKARAATARTSKQIQELVGGLRSMSASSFSAFERMEEKVAALEAEAQVGTALSAPESLEASFLALENKSGVEDELKALKDARGSNKPTRISDYMLPSASRQEVEEELEQLRVRARARTY